MTATETTPPAAKRPTPAQGILLLLAVFTVLGSFVAITLAIGIKELFGAWLFLVYWTSVQRSDIAKLPMSIIGAFSAILVAFLLQHMPIAMGPAGYALPGILIILIVYCMIMQWIPLFVNSALLIFLTVACIPAVQRDCDFGQILLGMLAGLVCFVAPAVIIMRSIAGRSARQQGAAA